METRDVRLVFNYITRIAKSYNLRPEITKSKGISINSIPSLLDQLKSREENASDAEHLDYMKNSLSIYSLPLITVPDIMEGKHKTSPVETLSVVGDEPTNEDTSVFPSNVIVEKTEESVEAPVEEKNSKRKDKKSTREKKEEKEEDNKKKKKKDKKEKKDKSKGITKLEKMKEKLHKKK